GEMDCDLAALQHPTVGEAHLGGALIGSYLDGFYDHQRVGRFAPERNLDLQALQAENSFEMFAQLLSPFEVQWLAVAGETADQQGVGGVLIEYPFDVFLENQVYVLPVKAPQRTIGNALFYTLRNCFWHY